MLYWVPYLLQSIIKRYIFLCTVVHLVEQNSLHRLSDSEGMQYNQPVTLRTLPGDK